MDDAPPVYAWITTITRVVVAGETAEFLIKLSRPARANETVRVHWATRKVTAVFDEDYVLSDGVIDFMEGEDEKTIQVVTLENPNAVGARAFSVMLCSPNGMAFLSKESKPALVYIVSDVPYPN